jgi:hypothetical protein
VQLASYVSTITGLLFGPKRDGVTGGWRKLHNEELHNLYSSPSIIRIIKSRRMGWAGYVTRIGEKRKVYREPEGKRLLRRPRRRWIENIMMDLLEIGLGGLDWICLAQDRYSSSERGNEPVGSIKCWETTEWLHNLWPLEWYSAPQS